MNNFKKFLITLITLAFSLTLISDKVSANSINVTTKETGIILNGYFEAVRSDGRSIANNAGYNVHQLLVNGNEAFCIEPEILVGSGLGYNVSDFNHQHRDIFSQIIYHGYDNTNKTYKDWVITQYTLWEYIGSIRNDLSINGSFSFDGINYQAEKAKIMDKVAKHNIVASFSNQRHNLKVNETITLNDTNNILANAEIVDKGGLDIIKENNQLKITANKNTPKNTTIKFKKFASITNDTKTAPLLYSHPTEQNFISGGNPDPIIFNIHLDIEHNGTLKIAKINAETKELIKNTTFNLADNKDMKNPTSYTTDSSGYTKEISLLAGTYYYQEVSVPKPLILDDTINKIEIKAGEDFEVIAKNDVVKGRIKLIKKSENNDLIKNAKFKLYDLNDNLVETLTTNTDGIAYSQTLALGSYTIVEDYVPEPYILDKSKHIIKVDYLDQNTPLVEVEALITNKFQRSDLTLNKIENNWDKVLSEYNGIKLSDATISLYAKEDIFEGSSLIYKKDQLIDTKVSDSLGQVKFKNLPLGKYYAKEIVAPKGYILFDGIWDITIKYDTDNPSVKVTQSESTLLNQIAYGQAKIHKTGKGGSEFLKGAIFGLYKEDDTLLFKYTTDDKGEVLSDNLRYGTYYFKEIEAPVGYHLNTNKYYFTISEDNHQSIIHIPIANEFIFAKVLVSKIDSETKKPLANVGFKILDDNNDVVSVKYQDGRNIITKDEWFTDSDGKFLLEASLPYGNYTLIESTPLEGYLPTPPYKFSIDENQSYLDIEIIGKVLDLGDIENDKIYGNLKILKLDKNTQKPLSDTTFEIYDKSFNLIDSVTTNNEGFIVLEDLVYGQYYIKEVAVPYPYVIDKDHQIKSIFISEHQKLYEVIFNNQITSIKILKVDKKTQEPITNTHFNLYDKDKKLLETLITDETGIVEVLGYDFDDYYIEEVFVPKPYILNSKNDLVKFTLSNVNNSYSIKYENNKAIGKLIINKIDDISKKPIKNVEFNLYKKTQENNDLTYSELLKLKPLKSALTNRDGIITFDNLEVETDYLLIEVSSPYGYKLSDTIHTLKIDYLDFNTKTVAKNYTIKNLREEVEIQVAKKDKHTDKIISDLDFKLELTDKDNKTLKANKIKDGIYYYTVLANEKYYLKEIMAPKGYSLSKKVIEIDTNKQVKDNIYLIDFYNNKIPNTGINDLTILYSLIFIASIFTLVKFKKGKKY